MAEPHKKLDWVTSGERRSASRGYSRFVRAMRFVLPLAAIGLTVVIILWDEMAQQMRKVDHERLLPELEQARGEMLSPQFDSTDSEGRPYTITAARATQDQNNPKITLLETPQAFIQLGPSENMKGTARSGVYEQEIGKLFLNKAVRLDHSSGYSLQSDELRVDLKTGQAFSDQPVHVEGNMGTIDALGMEADNPKGLLVFKGPATLILVEAGEKLSAGRTTP